MPHFPAQRRVLLIEDDALVALALKACAEAEGLEVLGPVTSAAAARRLLAEERPDYALLDYRLMDGTADHLVQTFRRDGIPFALLTGCSRWELPAGREPILQKPWDPQALQRLLTTIATPVQASRTT